MEFDIHAYDRDDVVVIVIKGRVTIETESSIDAVVTRVGAVHPQKIVIEVSGLESMSALGLGVLMLLRHTVIHRGGWVRVAGLNGKMLERFKEHHLEGYFERFDTVDDAVDARVYHTD